MGVSAEALDVILRIQNLRAFVAGSGEAAASIKGIGSAATASSNAQVAAAEKSAAAQRMIGKAAKWSALAVAAVAFEAYKLNTSFDQQIAQIGIVTHESGKQLETLRSKILDLAKPTGAKPLDLAEAMVHISKIDLPGVNRLNLLRAAADGAVVGLANVVETTDTLAGAIKVGMPGMARDVRTAMGQLITSAQTGNMSLTDFNHAMGTGVLPAAKVYGLTLQDVTGALSVFTDEHMNGASAMAQFATSFHFLTGATENARKGLKKIGLTGDQLADDMRGPGHMIAALTDLKQHLDTIADPSKRQDILNQILPGGRGRILLVLMNQLDNYGKKIEQQRKGTNSFEEDVAKAHQTAAFKAKAAWAGLESELIKLADIYKGPMTVAIVGVITLLASVVGWFVSNKYFGGLLIGTLGLLAAAWLATRAAIIVAAIATYAWDTAVAAMTIIALIAEVDSLSAAFALLGLAIETNAVGLIIVALVLVGVAIYELIKHFDSVKSWVMNNWPYIAIAIGVVSPPLLALIAIIILVAKHFGEIKGVALDVWGVMKDTFHWVENASKSVLNGMISLVNGVITAIDFLIKAYNKIPFHHDIGTIDPIGHVAKHAAKNTSASPHIAAHVGGAAVLPFGPAKKHVSPLSNNLFANPLRQKAAAAKGEARDGGVIVHSTLVLPNGKVLAETVNKVNADTKARKGK